MPTSLDAEKMNAFAGKMIGVLNQSALALMTSLGHRTGLFDSMARLTGPATTHQDRSRSETQRTVRPRVAWVDGHRWGGRVRPPHAHLPASAGARGVSNASIRA